MSMFRKRTPESSDTEEAHLMANDSPHQHDAENVVDLAVLLSQQNEYEEILRLIATKGMVLFRADTVSIMMLNPKTQHTIKTVIRDGTTPDERSFHLLSINITGWVISHRESFLSQDLPKDSRFTRSLFAESTVCSAMCVPIQNEGQVCGHIVVTSQDKARRFLRDDLEFLERCAAVWGAFLNDPRRVQGFFHVPIPDQVLVAKYSALGLLGRSRMFKELIRSVDSASQCDVRVFLEGESGTGKELVARAIHTLGSRRDHPFVAVDCGAIPTNLIESELFGHVKGAFTGATQTRRGLLEEANGGTMFIDEVQNLPYDMQAKLLRVLQEGEVRAVGSNQFRKVDVRIITASRTPATKLVKGEILREDLFYRLHVYPIIIPPLNERAEDIPLLAEHFVKMFASGQHKKAGSFEPSLVHFMRGRIWQGNVRELENFVERMVTLASSDRTVLDHTLLPEEYRSEFRALSLARSSHPARTPLRESLLEQESQIIRDTLIAYDWNQSEAARALGITERDMRYRMAKLGIKKHTL